MTTDPRFPTGKFHAPDTCTDASRATAIAAIDALPANLRKAVAGLSEAQLDTPYRDGGWTVRQLVHHVADSHANAYIRMKFARTEDKPTIMPYDEKVWAELPDAKSGNVEWSLAMLDGLHGRWAMLLRSFSATEFARTWVHPEYGERTLDWMTEMYSWHCRHHTAHVTELRKSKNW